MKLKSLYRVQVLALALLITSCLPFFTPLNATPPKKTNPDGPALTVTRVSEDFLKLEANNFCDFYALKSPDGIMLIDSGFRDSAPLTLKKLNSIWPGLPIKYIINTHMDFDHTGGNALLGKNATVIAHRRCREDLKKYKTFPKTGWPEMVIEAETSIYFDGKEIRIIPVPGCHTASDMLVYIPADKRMIVGDIISPDAFPVIKLNNEGSVYRLQKTVKMILNMVPEDTVFYCSHGRDCSKKDLKDFHTMLLETRAAYEAAVKAGKTLQQMKDEKILQKWSQWDDKLWKQINHTSFLDKLAAKK